jgi:HK97 gp10 family phage protein
MGMPKSVTRVNKGGVKFISNVDRAQYTINELCRAALRDSAKLIRKRMIDKLKQLPGMKRSKRLYHSTQYWVRKRDCDMQIGFKHDTWYGENQELGTKNQPARHILRDTVMENIDQIRIIQGKYLSAINDENRARGLISEAEYQGEEENEK